MISAAHRIPLEKWAKNVQSVSVCKGSTVGMKSFVTEKLV